jgi:hypothetical protein
MEVSRLLQASTVFIPRKDITGPSEYEDDNHSDRYGDKFLTFLLGIKFWPKGAYPLPGFPIVF